MRVYYDDIFAAVGLGLVQAAYQKIMACEVRKMANYLVEIITAIKVPVLAGLFLIMFLEMLLSIFMRAKNYHSNETASNFGILILYALGKVFIQPVFIASLFLVYEHSIFKFDSNNLVFFIILLLGIDFVLYWWHRLAHEVNFLWLFHSVHHSSSDFNLAISGRISVIEALYRWMLVIPFAYVGFPPLMILAAAFLIRVYVIATHTTLDFNRFEWANKIFNTPGLHRVHHGSEWECLDTNYGAVLAIWDRMFGSYKAPFEVKTYGLVEPITTKEPLEVNFVVVGRTIEGIGKTKRFVDKLTFLFKRPSKTAA